MIKSLAPSRRAARAGLLGATLAVISFAVSGCGGASSGASTAQPDASASGVSAGQVKATDQEFDVDMVPYHQAAIDMSRAELAHGKNPQVRAIAQKIMTEQQPELAQYSQLAQQLYKATPSATRSGPVGQVMSVPIAMDLSTMGNDVATASDVDQSFLSMMIPHHAGAVMMADQELKTGTNPTLKKMAAKTVSLQSQEIGQMQSMLTPTA